MLSVTVILNSIIISNYYYCMLLYAHAYCYDYFRQSALIRGVLTFVVPCRRAVTRYNAVPETTVEVLPRSKSTVGRIAGSGTRSAIDLRTTC